jgi:hypothetical protein
MDVRKQGDCDGNRDVDWIDGWSNFHSDSPRCDRNRNGKYNLHTTPVIIIIFIIVMLRCVCYFIMIIFIDSLIILLRMTVFAAESRTGPFVSRTVTRVKLRAELIATKSTNGVWGILKKNKKCGTVWHVLPGAIGKSLKQSHPLKIKGYTFHCPSLHVAS